MRPLPSAAALLTALTFAPILPGAVSGAGAGALFDGDAARQQALGEGVATWVAAPLQASDYQTGGALYDGEWWFGTYMMSAMGFGQLALEHPEARDRWIAEMERALERATAKDVRGFDAGKWGEDPLDAVDALRGDHAAYLGYLDLALSLHRRLAPEGRFAALNDAVSDALEARLQARTRGILETYPGEGYPVDNCAVIAGVALRAEATGQPHPPWLDAWADRMLEQQLDPDTGLLIQAARPSDGAHRSQARGSGSALCAYFLGFAWPERARALSGAVKTTLGGDVMGLGVVREYPPGVDGQGDVDSGPLVMGYSISATGFSLAGARMIGDRDWYTQLYGTARVFGAPDGHQFTTGGPLGNAILLAMLTAQPLGTFGE
ncbi:MAG: hypothetical protein H6739_10970 [Alphaproteobacteria bacterium]|nr:hypothetical protein [Alphaproteobacteria bacterium]